MAESPGDTIICRCYVVRKGAVLKAIADHGLRMVEEVTACTRAGGGCSSCWDDIRRILDAVWGKPPPPDAPDDSGLSSAEKRSRIRRVVDEDIQALLGRNGLSMRLVGVEGDRVLAWFFGDAVGTSAPSFLALKRYLVLRMAEACGRKMNLIELNVLARPARVPKP